MRPQIDERWIAHFKSIGYPQAQGLATGMEGAVYTLVPFKLVAKIWSNSNTEKARRQKRFYECLAGAATDIQTPEIFEIHVIDSKVVTIEKFLGGVLLEEYLSRDAAHADASGVDAILGVLRFLRSVPVGLFDSSIFDPDWSAAPAEPWGNFLQRMVSRRLGRYREQLQADITDLPRMEAAVGSFLATRNGAKLGLIHGDLCSSNVMADAERRPVSVFDFSFLSSIGDPLFDASISSSIFNMYGAHAGKIDKEVLDVFTKSLGYDRNVLVAYKAVYALLTSNIYSEPGTDGHYRWCVDILRRGDVRSSLGL